MDEVGQVIGTTTLRGFRFVIREGAEKHVRRDEFVSVLESVTGYEVLGIVKEIMISNELLPDEFGRDLRLSDIILTEGEYPVPTVKILGHEGDDGLEVPRYGIKPGTKVTLSSDEVLKRILSQEPAKSAHMGSLATRENVPVYININELISRHCAILAMTGAGKSYTVGVLTEELMAKGGSVVLFDLHGEFKDMQFEESSVRVLSVEGEDKIKVEVGELSFGDFVNLIPDISSSQRDLLDEVLSLAYRFYERYDLTVILEILGILYDMKKGSDADPGVFTPDILKPITKQVGLSTIGALLRRLKRLKRMDLFALHGTPLTDIVVKNQLTVINLSEADERVSETIIAAICRGIFEGRKKHVRGEDNGVVLSTPTFIIVEEAHNFAPRSTDDRNIISRSIIRKIAREGRKFGVGLCVVSQRPNKLDQDVLSQCNTQIIMKIMNPADQEYIRQSVETVTEDIVRDLPALSRGEAVIVGSAIRLPVPVRIRERKTAVGGQDVDFVGVWANG